MIKIMNSIETQFARVEVLSQKLAEAKGAIAPMLKDQTIPLDERWTAFQRLMTLAPLKVQSYGDGFVDWLGDNLTLYDDFYIERHETVMYVDFLERITDEYFSEKRPISPENIAEWKEQVLQSGYGGFKFDW